MEDDNLRRWRERSGENRNIWPYMATKFFEETLEADNQYLVNLPDGWRGLRDEASLKFSLPLGIMQRLYCKHHMTKDFNKCRMEENCEAVR